MEDDPTPWALINVLWSPKTNTTAGPQRQYSKTHYKWQGPNATVKLQRCKPTAKATFGSTRVLGIF